MRIHRTLAEAAAGPIRRRAIALGVFDGVHRGHRKILTALTAAREAVALDAGLVLTFDPHPLALVRPASAPEMILTLDERLAELERLGLDEVLVLPFTPELAATPYEAFTREILVDALGLAHLTAGYDFHLGRGRDGSAEKMAALGERVGFRVDVVSPCYTNGDIVSSTKIRRDLAAGDLPRAAAALGRPWRIGAEIVRGRGIGAGLGFPTANLATPPAGKLLPPAGVYLARTAVGKKELSGLMNLGWSPTVKNEFCIEIHLLDFEGDLYGVTLDVDVLQRLRGEETFSGIEELKTAIAADIRRARRILDAGPDLATPDRPTSRK